MLLFLDLRRDSHCSELFVLAKETGKKLQKATV